MKIFAAPLQGYTDRFFRTAHFSVIGGIEEYYAPFLHLEKGKVKEKELSDVLKRNDPVPGTIPQILVKTGEELAFFAEKLGNEMGYTRVDLNFGCPFAPVVKRGYGAGVLEEISVMKNILQMTERFPHIAFSVKSRLPEKREEDLHILFEYKLSHIVLHPRKASAQYNGKADLAAFERFRKYGEEKGKGKTPVVYNGDINDSSHVPENTFFLMLGRGLLKDPLLARKIKGENFLKEEENQLWKEFHSFYVSLLLEGTKKAEEKLPKLKTFWEYFLPEKDKRIRKKLFKCRTFEEYKDFTEELFSI